MIHKRKESNHDWKLKFNPPMKILPLSLNISTNLTKKIVPKYKPSFKLLDTLFFLPNKLLINTSKCFGIWKVNINSIQIQSCISIQNKMDILTTLPTFFNKSELSKRYLFWGMEGVILYSCIVVKYANANLRVRHKYLTINQFLILQTHLT